MRTNTVFGIVAIGASLLIGGLFAEGTLRVYSASNPAVASSFREFDPLAVQIEPHGLHGYRQRPNALLHYANGTTASSNSMGFRGPEVPVQPAPGTTRIVLIGGSTTHGWGVSDGQTIDAHMRAIFQERFPDRRFEVVNLGYDGYDSFQMLERLKSDALRLHPTVIVLNEGINDVRNAQYANLIEYDPRTLFWDNVLERLKADEARGGPTLWARVKHVSFVARIPAYIRQSLQRRREEKERLARFAAHAAPVAGDSSGRRSGVPFPEAATYFERNMRRMVSLAADQGAAVLLSTPPSSLHWYADTATSNQSYWVIDAKTTQLYRDNLAGRLRAIADSARSAKPPVRYVSPIVSDSALFLDDCHLKGPGNRIEAEAFVNAIMAMLPATTRR